MEEVLVIEGKQKLNGTVKISASKNATVALIPASILANGIVTIREVPDISDVDSLVHLLRFLGSDVTIKDNNHIIVDSSNLSNKPLDNKYVAKLRASYYFMGALLGRFKEVKMKMPGGCYLGPRPIDLHLKGFEALGATITNEEGFINIKAKELIGTKIYLDFASVGATINIMMAAVLAKGKTIIENAAKEPEIIDVSLFLSSMGAKIRGAGTSEITIEGVESLNGCVHEIIPDRIEAGTYIIMAAACAEKVVIENIIPQHLDALLSKLEEVGVNLEIDVDKITIHESNLLKSVSVKTGVYPGLATDLQQPLTTLLLKAQGTSKIKDTIYPERFLHCRELHKMGAEIEVGDGMSSFNGPIELYGSEVTATDLRGGAALVIAGLIAKGKTIISDIYHIDRGYDNLEGKLKALGANIYRESR